MRNLRGYKGWAVGIVDLEASFFDDAVERVNITLPRRVLRRLDDMARSAGQSRSGLIARLTVASSKDWAKPKVVRRASRA